MTNARTISVDNTFSMRRVTASHWASYGLATVVYLAGAALIRPIFISDTVHYLKTSTPGTPLFWDFGHLLWRPFLFVLLNHVSGTDASSRFLHAFYILDALSTTAGLIGICFAVATLRLFTRSFAATAISATILSFTQAVLTHSKGGCAYIFCFAALSAGFYSLLAAATAEQTNRHNAAIAGGLLALALCLWLPCVFALPGVLLAPLFFGGNSRKQRQLVGNATGVCGLFCLTIYAAVALHLGIRDPHGFATWALASSHGITTSGAKRVFFGFARSFISLDENGDHGVLFKRFLLHDPYNPVRIWEILGLTFWKIVLFYVFVAFTLKHVSQSPQGRRALLMLLATSLPVLGFAIVWAGTDLERYLPLFPAFMLAMGLGLDQLQLRPATACLTSLFVITLVTANLTTLSASVRERHLGELSGTIRSLNELLPADSLVLLPPMHPLQRIYWDYPETLPLAAHGLKLERIVDLSMTDTPQWRTRVCSDMSQRWRLDKQVVVESSLLLSSPKADSLWVEGDDHRVCWRDINNFVGSLDLGFRIGNTAFVLIPATARNVETTNHCRWVDERR
jgi:hypothetical protein